MNPATSFYLDLYRRCLDLRRTVIWSMMAANLALAVSVFTAKDQLVGKLAGNWILGGAYLCGFILGWALIW
jgi:hypothetical protein